MSRKQIPSPQKKAQTKSSGRSEELDEIIDRMPMAFGKWVALAVIVFAALFLLFGWIIKYPDMVTGQIKINAQNPTIRLVANSTGNLLLLSHKAQEEVKKGEYIAVVQNPASTEDVRKIADLINRIDFDLKKQVIFVSDRIFFRNVCDGGRTWCEQASGTIF